MPPQELGLMTHVTLFDEERTAPYALAGDVLAMGHGVDEADTLLDRAEAVDRYGICAAGAALAGKASSATRLDISR